MIVNKIVTECVETGIYELKKEKYRKILEDDIVGPLIQYILEQIKPYILGMSIFLSTIIILIICVLSLLLIKSR